MKTEARAGVKALDLWLPPPAAGRPIGCISTSFTFDQEFFERSCVARFLRLQTERGESTTAAVVVDEEEAFSEARVTVLVDQSQGNRPDARNLRWDLLPVAVPGGLLHAKLTLLQWEHFLRVIVGSANLTPAGYRTQAEIMMAFEAAPETEVSAAVFEDLFAAAEGIIDLAPGQANVPGPKMRAARTLSGMRAFVNGLGLPATPARGDPRIRVCMTGPGHRSMFEQVRDVWGAPGPPRDALVLSPFFDTGPSVNQTAQGLQAVLAQRGDRRVTFIMRVDEENVATIARAPKALLDAFGAGTALSFQAFRLDGDPRRLHGKSLMLYNDTWISAVFGSSNFTAKGTGVASQPHVEVNVAVGAPWSSDVAQCVWAAVPDGTPFEPDAVSWEPGTDDEEAGDEFTPLPAGFVDALLDPGEQQHLQLQFDPSLLPPRWRISVPGAVEVAVYDSTRWQEEGRPTKVRVAAPGSLFFLHVEWEKAGQWLQGWLVLNVTDPSKLPPPAELRDLTLDVLMAVLTSSRPFCTPCNGAHPEPGRTPKDSELDPLKRFTNSGYLLQRVRRYAAALVGLRDRLQRPAHSLEALAWRLFGPLGPKALVDSIVNEATAPATSLAGEAAFLLAELALMLGEIDWHLVAGRDLTYIEVAGQVNELQYQVRTAAEQVRADPALADYVAQAFRRVRS